MSMNTTLWLSSKQPMRTELSLCQIGHSGHKCNLDSMSIHHCWVEEQEDPRCKGLEVSWRKELQKRRLDARDVEILVTLEKLANCQRLEKMVRQLHLGTSPRKGTILSTIAIYVILP